MNQMLREMQYYTALLIGFARETRRLCGHWPASDCASAGLRALLSTASLRLSTSLATASCHARRSSSVPRVGDCCRLTVLAVDGGRGGVFGTVDAEVAGTLLELAEVSAVTAVVEVPWRIGMRRGASSVVGIGEATRRSRKSLLMLASQSGTTGGILRG